MADSSTDGVSADDWAAALAEQAPPAGGGAVQPANVFRN